MKKLLNKKGFTLIELIVVIAILAILAMILIPSLTGYIKTATKSKDQANCRALYSRYQLDLATKTAVQTNDQMRVSMGTGATSVTPTVVAEAVTEFVCITGAGTFSLTGNFQ